MCKEIFKIIKKKHRKKTEKNITEVKIRPIIKHHIRKFQTFIFNWQSVIVTR